jgi:hypothetical protein
MMIQIATIRIVCTHICVYTSVLNLNLVCTCCIMSTAVLYLWL